MKFSLAELIPLLPEIFLLIMLSFILVVDVLLRDEERFVTYVLSLLSLAGCAWLTFAGLNAEPVYVLSSMFVDDAMADVLKLVLYVAVAAMLVYSRGYLQARGLYKGEYYVLTGARTAVAVAVCHGRAES
jgi:NADH-quinone oxidoreductase subunit N